MSLRANDPEYDLTWGPHEKYTFDECVSCMTDGYREPIKPYWESFCRRRARKEFEARHALEAAERAASGVQAPGKVKAGDVAPAASRRLLTL